MTQYGYALLGLTAIVGVLVAVLTFAILRFGAAARDTRRHLSGGGADAAILAMALQDAVARLKSQEQAMSARAAASEQLRAEIVDSLTAGLLLVDKSGRIEILNPAGRRMLGTSDDIVGTNYRDALADLSPLVDIVSECLQHGRPIARRALQVSGRTPAMHFGVTVSPLASGEAVRGVICLFSDLTAVVDLEERLRLKEALARLGELAAGIAHEFRNGLATIHGYAHLIDPQSVPAAYQPYIEGIRQETEALGRVVTNFLKFARPEEISLLPVDLGAVVRRVADELRHELPEGTTLDVAGAFGTIQGDDVLLRQVFANLVRNAVEACETAQVRPVVALRGELDADKGLCHVCVDDNGPGVPAASRDRIFQPFFTTRSRGTGLGLAIVLKITVLHNGRVSVDASPTGGASFRLTFPLTES